MKKILLSLAVVLFSASAAMAENNLFGLFNIGGRIGIVSSNQTIPTTGEGIKDAINADGTGWTGTVFARINIPKLPIYLQPELQYTNTTINLPSLDNIFGGDEETTTQSHKYIDMPILVGAEFGLGNLASVRINAGPVFAIATEKGFKDLTKEDFEQAWNSVTTDPQMSWTAGIGVKVLSLIAEVRYNGNFKNNKIDTADIEGSINTDRTSWNLSIGVMF